MKPSSAALSSAYKAQCRMMKHSFRHCREEFEVEKIHQFRVAVKKIRALLKLIKYVSYSVSPPEDIPLRNQFNDLYKQSGRLRDVQVQIELLEILKKESGIRCSNFEKWLHNREQQQLSQFRKCSKQVHLQVIPGEKLKKIKKRLFEASDEVIRARAVGLIENIIGISREIIEMPISECDLHRLRISLKQLRFIVSVMSLIYTGYSHPVLSPESLLEMETAVGHWHDLYVREILWWKYFKEKSKPDSPLSEKDLKLFLLFRNEREQAFEEARFIVRERLMCCKTSILE